MDIYQGYNQQELVTTLTETLGFDMEPDSLRKVDEAVTDVISYMVTGVSSFLLSVPQKFINFVIMLFVFFYAFKDGKSILNATMKAIPLDHTYSKRIKEKISTTIQSLLYGEIVISVLEGIIGTIGFMILGIGSPVLLGLLVALVALFPAIGPAIIWFPLTLYFLLIGETLKGIIVGFFGFFILSILLDTITRAKVLGMKGHIHPVIILVGLIGGIATFGIIGLILGPLILVLLQLVFEIYLEQKNETQS
jgi:predicted PurR-regulated permease PerM